MKPMNNNNNVNKVHDLQSTADVYFVFSSCVQHIISNLISINLKQNFLIVLCNKEIFLQEKKRHKLI